MSSKTYTYDNCYQKKISKLYLDMKTSDVNFVFDIDTDHPEKIPAHKAILSIDNPVFDTMFYGSIKEGSDIPISDASAAAFKEFLQFFYLERLTLSTENIVQVMNLCKKYEMDECMMSCQNTMKQSLTFDDMCLGYSIALLLEQKDLIEFCEKEIRTNAREIIKSESFLECGRSLLDDILKLVTSHWSAMEMFAACLEWAEAECNRHNLDPIPKNLRIQLGDLFNRVPFEEIGLEQFSQFLITCEGFFHSDEIETIKYKIKIHNEAILQTTLRPGQVLDCDRCKPDFQTSNIHFGFTTTFSSNKRLMLTKFYVPIGPGVEITYSVAEFGPPLFDHGKPIVRSESSSPCIVLPEPCVIKVGRRYRMFGHFKRMYTGQLPEYKDLVKLEQHIEIRFVPAASDMVSRLIFQIPEN